MKKFDDLKEQAKLKGHKLLRAAESDGCAKTGYVVWYKWGTWSRYATLKDVQSWLNGHRS